MDSELLLSRAADVVYQCNKAGAARFLGFLSPEQIAAVKPALKNQNHCFNGGYTGAQRCFLAVYPEWEQSENLEFPITPLTFIFRKENTLAHRDFLGALLALGIKRETVGDILIEKGRAVAFISSDVADFVKNQITAVGKTGVTVSMGLLGELPPVSEKVRQSSTVASSRIDCIIAALTNMSRTAAASAIIEGRVSVNSFTVTKLTQTVNSGDVITVRSYGKFNILSLNGVTKKGRTVLVFQKYL